MEGTGIRTGFWCKNLKENTYLEDLNIVGEYYYNGAYIK
jgi:hypothetical protein